MAPDAEETLLKLAIAGQCRRIHHSVDAAVHHDRHVVGHRGGHPDVLLDDEDRDLALLSDPDQHVLDLLHDHRREPLRRLVHHQQTRVEQQRAGDREHLLLAAGELAAPARASQRKARECVVDALAGPSAAGAARAQAQMLVHRQRCPQPPPLGHVPDPVVCDPARTETGQLVAFELDGAARHGHEPRDRVAQRGLAHAVATDDGDDAVREVELDPLQRAGLAVVDVQPADPQHRRLPPPLRALSHYHPFLVDPVSSSWNARMASRRTAGGGYASSHVP